MLTTALRSTRPITNNRSCNATDDSTDQGDRRQANQAVAVSAVGLALAGGIDLALALFTARANAA